MKKNKQKKVETKLKELEVRYRQLFEITADATHELRTPIAIMKGNVDLAMLRGEKFPKSAFKAINYEIKHLSEILGDLSLITSQAGQVKNRVVYAKVNLRRLIATVVLRCKVLAFKKNISITSKKIPNVILLGDSMYLEKMLVNLIKNSILYGIKNGHTVIEANEFNDSVVLKIIDDGIGITKEDLPHIFERFYRVKKHTVSKTTSIGLGLAIVKWIAEIHGGTVSAESVGKGSIFSIRLPFKK